MNRIVRRATLDDLPLLLNFEQGLIQAERPMDPTIRDGDINYYDISEFIRDENAEVYVVEEAGEIVASGCARIRGDRHYLKHDRIGYLGFMFVPETKRGQGLNKLIISALLNWCRDKGLDEIRLDVYNSNIPAIRAYEKAGFVKHLINMRLNLKENPE
ncbi:MAG: GNAT family N-acetyltransferase [Flavobacteriaceae bacterium]|nr:GNAT family N-acetyltransferase [Bacteroidia bacterium]NNK88787.1 GNAT family N-acetyltransferase [Flavobacteriaceae bacterium]